MPKRYKRFCNQCGKYYNGCGRYYCSSSCMIKSGEWKEKTRKTFKEKWDRIGRIGKKESDRRYKIKLGRSIQELYNDVGRKCFICGSKKYLVCHRKNFKRHIAFSDLGSVEKLREIKKNEYVRLCYPCHFAIHWLHRNFKMSWKDIENLRKP